MTENLLVALIIWGAVLVIGLHVLDRHAKHFERKINKGMKTLQDFLDSLESK